MGREQQELAILVTAKNMAGRVLAGAKGQVRSLERAAAQGARNAGRNIERAAMVGVIAAASLGAAAVNVAVEWESAFAGVEKTVEATATTTLPMLEDGLRGMSRELPIANTELAAIAETAGALGIRADDILAFTKTVALIGITTDVSTDQAAVALGQLQNVLGLTADDFDNFASSLVDLGNKGASTESQILEIARRSGGAANLFGIAKDQTLGWAAAAANLGMNQELAGTALQKVFLTALPAYTTGSRQLQAITGLTGKQLKKAYQTDAGGALEFLFKRLGELPKEARLAAAQDIFGKTSGVTRLVLGLADSYEKNLVPALGTSTEAWEQNVAMQREAEKRFATTESALIVFKNNIRDAGITIGSALLPQLAELAREGSAWLRDHPEEIEAAAKALGDGFRDAVSWAKSLDWGQIADTLKAGAGFAKTLVDTFLNLPPGLQQLLAGGYVANKFTGGAVTDVVGTLLKLGVRSMFVNAGVVNVNGAVGPGGVAGAGAGKGRFGMLGGLSGMLGLAVGGGLLMGSNAGAAGGGLDYGGFGGNAAGGALAGLMFGPLGVLGGALAGIVKSVAEVESSITAAEAGKAHAGMNAGGGLAGASTSELNMKLAAIDTGLRDIRGLPFGELLHGEAIAELELMRTEVVAALEANGDNADAIIQANRELQGRIAAGEKLKAPKGRPPDARDSERNTAAVEDVRAAVEDAYTAAERTKAAVDTRGRETAVALAQARTGIVGAINALDLSVVVHNTANFAVSVKPGTTRYQSARTTNKYTGGPGGPVSAEDLL